MNFSWVSGKSIFEKSDVNWSRVVVETLKEENFKRKGVVPSRYIICSCYYK